LLCRDCPERFDSSSFFCYDRQHEEALLTAPFPHERGAPRRRQLIYILLLLTVNLFVFLPSMSGDFLWDDKYFISENPTLMGTRFLHDFWRSPFGGFSGTDENSVRLDRELQFYRPLTSLSYWLDLKIWGLNPAAFHLTNILLHTLNGILLFFILLRLRLDLAVAFSGTLLFSVFPTHFENVAWISGRTDLLSFFFGALSALFFLFYLEKKGRGSLGLSAFFFLAGLLSKENIIFLPAILLLIVWRKKSGTKEFLRCSVAFLMGVLAWFALRKIAFGAVSANFSGRSLSDFLATVGFYVARTVFPFDLSVTIDSAPVFGNWAYITLGLLLTALFVISVVQVISRQRLTMDFFFAFFIYVLLLLPSAVVIFSSLSISLIAWRFLYLPSAIFVIAVAYILLSKVRPQAVGYVLVILLTIGYAVEVYPKSQLFGRAETNFWLGIQKIEREDLIAQFNIGVHMLPKNEKRALEIFEQILARKGHPLYPLGSARVYEELAIYFAFQRDFSKAEHYFDILSRQQGGMSLHSTFNYCYYLAFSGRREEGESIIQDLVGRYPRNHDVLTRAAKFYVILKDYSKAAELFERDYSLFRNEQTRRFLEELRPLLETKDH
jgi:tetratricopeptide (TPR) repeat protein